MEFAVQTNGVVAAPAAGAIYWFALFVLGRYVSPYSWCLIAFIASGLMFPLALLLQKPTRSNMMVKDNPLTGASLAAFINIAVAWPITIAAFCGGGRGSDKGSSVHFGRPLMFAIVSCVLAVAIAAACRPHAQELKPDPVLAAKRAEQKARTARDYEARRALLGRNGHRQESLRPVRAVARFLSVPGSIDMSCRPPRM
jgi:hypothetical protein